MWTPPNHGTDVFSSSGSLGKALEKFSKDKESNSSDLGCKKGGDKQKQSRVIDKILTANSNPFNPRVATKMLQRCRPSLPILGSLGECDHPADMLVGASTVSSDQQSS